MKWKKLEIDNLPPDILTGDYEFKYETKTLGIDSPWDYKHPWFIALANGVGVLYRKIEPYISITIEQGDDPIFLTKDQASSLYFKIGAATGLNNRIWPIEHGSYPMVSEVNV